MVNVADVVADAQYGELSQLAVKDNIPAILSFMYLGILELHKRFDLLTKEYVLELYDNVTEYQMPSDCLKILAVYNEEGDWHVLNDEDDALSVLTPAYNLIQVPNPEDGAFLSIMYSAVPARITYDEETNAYSPSELPIPAGLYEALLHYIGYRGHGSVNGDLSTENNSHYMRFDKSCTKAKELGMLTQDNTTNYKLDFRGFA